MGRLSGITENGNAMAPATYTAIGQVSQLTYDNLTESRAYDPVMQLLTRMAAIRQGDLLMDMQYLNPAGTNNGRISQTIDGVTGETVSYTYDALNRLATAASSGGWSQSYVYDGFGNVQGSNGAWVNAADPATNRPSSSTTYDANGLPGTAQGPSGYQLTLGWDVENRLVLETNYATWWYDASNKRVMGQGRTGGSFTFTGSTGGS